MDAGKYYAIVLQSVGYFAFFGFAALIAKVFHWLLPNGRLKRWLFRRIGN
jgi:hypothetical protein